MLKFEEVKKKKNISLHRDCPVMSQDTGGENSTIGIIHFLGNATHFTVRGQNTAKVTLAPAYVLLHKRWCPVCDQDVVQLSLFTLIPTCCSAAECCLFP